MNITFRPHHFLCALCFQGKGYSPEFINHFSQIMQDLNSAQGDNRMIEVTEHTDSICAPCPHKRDKLCTTQKKILRLDQAHAEILKIKIGDTITWGEAKNKIIQYMTLEKFHHACEPCEWKKTGMCEKVLKHTKEENKYVYSNTQHNRTI